MRISIQQLGLLDPFSMKCREPSHGVTRDCKWSTMTLQVVSLSKSKQHRTENNRSWLTTRSQVIKPWLLKIHHDKSCHTFMKPDVTSSDCSVDRSEKERCLKTLGLLAQNELARVLFSLTLIL